MMTISFELLNENQLRAVSWNEGPLLVLAGPGSGKTRVLTLRLARLIEENENASVLALTFTNKAAAEMRNRVELLLGQRTNRAHLCTFHSFSADLLRQHGSHLGLRPDFSLITQDEDRVAFLEEVIGNLPEGDDPLPMDRKNLLEFVDRLFADSYNGGNESSSLRSLPGWVPLLHKGYCEALLAANRLDFGSLLHFARRLLTDKPGVAHILKLSWNFVCVDEFQDTNQAQYDLLRLMAPTKQSNLFAVGDDDQIIYEWNGASPKRFQEFRRNYEVETIQLPQCYRCPSPIIALANRLIAHNVGRLSGKRRISSEISGGLNEGAVRYGAFPSPEKEAAFVPRDIRDRKLKALDCVVLGRTARLINGVASELRRAGYDAFVPHRKYEFESPSVRVLVEALRLANARHDRSILRRLCLAWGRLTGAVLEPDSVAAAAALVGGDFLRAWADAAADNGFGNAAKVVGRIRSDLVDSLSFPMVVDWFVDQGWRTWNEEDDDLLTSDEIKTWRSLHREITREYNGNLTLNAYIQSFDLTSKALEPGPNAVRCMTVHGAKGLEFNNVYLIGMAQELFPSYHALRNGPQSKEMEEERRNCFVAITRVEKTLTLTWSQRYFGYTKQPSQFLNEMGIDTSAFGA